MKGTILDFLQIATENPELAKGLAELAERFDFEFTEEELDDEDLGKVAGGTTVDPTRLQTVTGQSSKTFRVLSNVLKQMKDTQSSTTQNFT